MQKHLGVEQDPWFVLHFFLKPVLFKAIHAVNLQPGQLMFVIFWGVFGCSRGAQCDGLAGDQPCVSMFKACLRGWAGLCLVLVAGTARNDPSPKSQSKQVICRNKITADSSGAAKGTPKVTPGVCGRGGLP